MSSIFSAQTKLTEKILKIFFLLTPKKLLVIEGAGSALIAFVTNIVVARTLGVESYGLLIQAIASYVILRSFFQFRMSEAIAWGMSKQHIKTDLRTIGKLITVEAIMILLPILIGYVLYLTLKGWLEFSNYTALVGLAMLPTMIDTVFEGVGRYKERYKVIVSIRLARKFLLLVFVTLIPTLTISTYIDLMLATHAILFLIQLSILLRISASSISQSKNEYIGSAWSEFKSYLIRGWGLSIIINVTKNIDVLLIGQIAGNSSAGLYRIAKGLGAIISNLNAPLNFIAFRVFLKNKESTDKTLEVSRFIKESVWIFFMLLPVVSIVIVFSDTIIAQIYGDQFVGAAPLVSWMLPAILLLVTLYWLQSYFLANNLINKFTYVYLLNFLVLTTGLVVLVNAYGVVGAAYAYSISLLSMLAAMSFIVYKREAVNNK